MASSVVPVRPPTVVRRESVTWPTDDPPPQLKSYGSFSSNWRSQASTLLPSSQSTNAGNFVHSPRTERRLQWRALLLAVSTVLLTACFLVVVILVTGRTLASPHETSPGKDGPLKTFPSLSPKDSFKAEDEQPYLLAVDTVSNVKGGATDAFPGAYLAKASSHANPSPGYPSSAPEDPNIKIPVTMGCLEAMCESWMAALGQHHGDGANLTLLDCIQRTGMSADGTRACFAMSHVTDSAERVGLYQCAVCEGCLAPQSKEEKAALCQTGSGKGKTSAKRSAPSSHASTPSASAWDRYVPKGFAP
ncbi:hypothetical protein Naga_100013g24 [Nannochloropsis gaditana]|uniref:Uncharacterized protein n=1 Tax=Nannochloropsis gaditana TaxID=72520 RepID=W7UC41_9STRA|nr:hypothetical protein Naga_100013g24 [Nannochloropsis gaditana]